MDCESIRVAISASLDGEDAGIPAGVTQAHLDECPACRAWRERQHALTRRARLVGPALDHDLAGRVLAALAAQAIPAQAISGQANPAPGNPPLANPGRMSPEAASPQAASPETASPEPVSPEAVIPESVRPDAASGRAAIPAARRAALALVAAGQLAVTVPLLVFGHDREAGVHAAHELGSFDLALAIAFVVGVIRPKLSAGLAWPCCVAAVGLAGTAISDMISKQTFGADEAQHLVAVAGALLLFWQSRDMSSRTRPADPATGVARAGAADASSGAADSAGWSDGGARPGNLGKPVARKADVA
ncbi:MAG TPA: zf-HC2 domain-containing protein [Trebonia sp.]|jgi:predicted anti-sigma-YlaC factor YlaD|nr:zf-HC2 domain-containing protein [Trebonia sp.]